VQTQKHIAGNETIVELLLDGSVSPNASQCINCANKDKDTCMLAACATENLNVAQLLLKQPNIDVNCKDYFGDTAVVCLVKNATNATEATAAQIMGLLIKKGADLLAWKGINNLCVCIRNLNHTFFFCLNIAQITTDTLFFIIFVITIELKCYKN